MATSTSSDQQILALETEIARLTAERDEALGQGVLLKTLMNDMAERRKIEGQLRQANEWLHLAQEAGKVAAYTYDFRSERLEWSPSTIALYGLSDATEPTIEAWLAAIHPDDRAAATAVAEAAIEQYADVKQRFRVVQADGTIVWVQDRGRIILGADGRPERLVGINVDITELVELEQRASANEERLRLAMRAKRIACWDWDLVSGRIDWDDRLAPMAGFDPEFGGTFEAFWAMVHDDDRPRVRAALDAAISGPADYDVEFRMARPDGSLRWTHANGVVARDATGKALRMVGVDADITRRKEAEGALRENDRFLQSVLDASTDCIKVIELDGSLSFMNRNGQCIMEVSDILALLGKPWESLWPGEGAVLVREAMDAARAGEPRRFEAFCPTAAGTPKWWEVSVAPILDEQGRPSRIVSISRDITERWESAEQLRLFNAELHHRLKNNLATIQAMARATLRTATSPQEFEESFSQRLTALANTFGLLREGADAATLQNLVEAELRPFESGHNSVIIAGPEIALEAEQAVATGMIIHELTTNACKYGSLSGTGGRVTVDWAVASDGGRRILRLMWIEEGGPPVDLPSRTGFGSRLIDRLSRQWGGSLTREWAPGGLTLRLEMPLR